LTGYPRATYIHRPAGLHLDAAPRGLRELERRHGGVGASESAGGVPGGEHGWAADEEVVAPGDPAPDLPLDPAVDLDLQRDEPGSDVLLHGVGDVPGHGHGLGRQHGGPDGDVAVALVLRREGHRRRDGLVAVGDEDVEALVEDADAVVGVAGGERHLRGRREGRVADADGPAELQVLQVEGRLGGAQREVDDQRDEGHHEDQRQQARRHAAAAAAQVVLVPVVVLLPLAHG
jgi:hypothetical protein